MNTKISVASLKPVVADGQPAHDVGRNVVEEDEPQGEPAEQVETDVANGGGDHAYWYRRRIVCANASRRRKE
jgi:hypothetical protein